MEVHWWEFIVDLCRYSDIIYIRHYRNVIHVSHRWALHYPIHVVLSNLCVFPDHGAMSSWFYARDDASRQLAQDRAASRNALRITAEA